MHFGSHSLACARHSSTITWRSLPPPPFSLFKQLQAAKATVLSHMSITGSFGWISLFRITKQSFSLVSMDHLLQLNLTTPLLGQMSREE